MWLYQFQRCFLQKLKINGIFTVGSRKRTLNGVQKYPGASAMPSVPSVTHSALVKDEAYHRSNSRLGTEPGTPLYWRHVRYHDVMLQHKPLFWRNMDAVVDIRYLAMGTCCFSLVEAASASSSSSSSILTLQDQTASSLASRDTNIQNINTSKQATKKPLWYRIKGA